MSGGRERAVDDAARPAPPWQVSRWFNAPGGFGLEALRGRVVVLEAFLHEYRIGFPVGVDEAAEGPIPRTMRAYGMQGTPTLVLIDARGMLRGHHFGQISDLALGARIATLLVEAEAPVQG